VRGLIDRPSLGVATFGRVIALHRSAVIAATCLAVAACGGSSPGANKLLQQTFSGNHVVNSGNLRFSVTVTPSGSRTLTQPITFSFGGPFQGRGKGNLPASDFEVSASAQGKTGSLGVLSTGTTGYVTLGGTSYQLPASTFTQLESSFAQLASSSSGGSTGGSALSKLGIDPLHWLVHPSVAGTENLGGAGTTHIRAGVNVQALLQDLNTFLQKASSLGVSGAGQIPSGISANTRSQIAGKVENPSFDVWTGSQDKTVRKLTINMTLPVSGQDASLLGGLSSAGVSVVMEYANLNQPQTITAPATVRPFSEFTARVRPVLQEVESALALGVSGASPSSGTGSASSLQSYSQCISAAGNDVAKMQRCAPLLNGK
jgi:hypothetical protein